MRSPDLLAAIALAVVLVPASAATTFAGTLPRNWPLRPADLQRRFEQQPFAITDVEPSGGGRTGALKVKLEFDDGKVVEAKWKPVSDDSLDDWNNSPRRELASYRIQSFFLDENDYVVPTSAPRCVPLEVYRPIEPAATPTLEGSHCVLGVLSVWLHDVSVPDPFFDEARFAGDPLYARRLADFNLLTYLIDHRDGKRDNLLRSTDASDPRSFSVDNGISFESFPWNMEAVNWNKFHVPWLFKESVDRLRRVDEARLAELGVVAELRLDEHGMFQVTSPGANMDGDRGVRQENGRIQFGLTKLEISRVHERIAGLLQMVDSGKIAVR